MLVKQKLAFSKKCKNMNTKQEIVSDADFKAWSFSSDFNFACKDGRITKATCKYYCLLVVNSAITNCCKEFHLKCVRVPRSVFENVTIHEDLSGFVSKPVFFLVISKCCHLYRKSLCFSLLPFTVWWSIFISLLDGCYHYLVFMDPLNGCSKSKLLTYMSMNVRAEPLYVHENQSTQILNLSSPVFPPPYGSSAHKWCSCR